MEIDGIEKVNDNYNYSPIFARNSEKKCERWWTQNILQCLLSLKTWARKSLKYCLTQTIGELVHPYSTFLVGQGQHHLPHLINPFCTQFHSVISQKRTNMHVRCKYAFFFNLKPWEIAFLINYFYKFVTNFGLVWINNKII